MLTIEQLHEQTEKLIAALDNLVTTIEAFPDDSKLAHSPILGKAIRALKLSNQLRPKLWAIIKQGRKNGFHIPDEDVA